MKASSFLEDEFGPENFQDIAKLRAAQTANFTELCTVCNLNPKTDFLNSDLGDIDFSNSDLRGFNFSGANFDGAFGRDYIADETTLFAGADIENSVFAYKESQKDFFDSNPTSERQFRILRGSDWLGVASWLGENIKRDPEGAARMGLRLFDVTQDQSVRSQILYYAKYNFKDRTEYRDFLVSQISHSASPAVLVSCLKILGALYMDARHVRASCMLLLTHHSESVRLASLTALMNSGQPNAPELLSYIQKEPSEQIRRYFTGRVVARMSDAHEKIAREDLGPERYRDFRQPITLKTLERLAELRLVDTHEPVNLPPDLPLDERIDEAYRLRSERRLARVRELFNEIKEMGIPFHLDR